ncbi:MAG: hypothetical protein KGJ48_19560, partial [Nitrospirota bacterium]|nr:hypothetical protein [Nitrospirota bacterium]
MKCETGKKGGDGQIGIQFLCSPRSSRLSRAAIQRSPSFEGVSSHSGEFTLKGVNARLRHKRGRTAHGKYPVA